MGTFSVSFFTVTLWTSTTPCSCCSVLISISVMPDSSRQRMTPRDEFNALWMETRTGLSTNRVVLRRPIACDFLAHSTRKDPSLNLSMLLRVPATAWNPSGQQRATVYSVEGRHSTTPRPETLANFDRSCRSVRYPTPCPNLGRCPVIFFLYLWVPCYVCERFITFCPHPPPSPARGCTQAAFHQVRTRAQNAIYSGDKNNNIKFNSIP